MTDELDNLKKTLREDAPAPNPAARKAAIQAGLVAFDAEFSDTAQGSPARERQRGRFPSFLQTLFGRRSMNLTQPRFRYVLAGGASVAILALVVFGSNLPKQYSQENSFNKITDDRSAGDYDEAKIVATTSQDKREVDAIVGGQTVHRELAAPLDELAKAQREKKQADRQRDEAEERAKRAEYELGDLIEDDDPNKLIVIDRLNAENRRLADQVKHAERIDPLRYQPSEAGDEATTSSEMAFLKIRYKLPDSDTSTLITQAITDENVSKDVSSAPREARFAAAVAGFGQLLRGGRYTGDYGYDQVITLAQGAKGDDDFGYRSEFISLVRLAKSAADLEALRR